MRAPWTPDPESAPAALRNLRRARQARRLGDTEWFDVLYRVYLFALVGLVAIVTASDAIDGLVGDAVTTRDLVERGPTIAGVVVALAVAVGVRNGADGGPISVESADVRHVLMSPIDRRRALLLPAVQRLRAVVFLPALVTAIVAQLVARELEGLRAAWAASGALFGTVVGASYVSAAVVSHALRVPRWAASVGGTGGVVWQIVAALSSWRAADGAGSATVPGPTSALGSVLFWGIRQRPIDVVALLVVVAVVVVALALVGRLRLEPLERRGRLVSQLRFAATVQDIRTVVLLRRQLRAESVRTTPWLPIGHAPSPDGRTRSPAPTPDRHASRPTRRPTVMSATPGDTATGGVPGGIAVDRGLATMVWRRGAVSVARLPLSRVVRIVLLAGVAGASASLVVSSTYLFAIPFVGALFLLGLEAIEPLAQEIDRPDITESLPIDRGWLFLQHLVAPAGVLAVAGLVGATVATVLQPSQGPAAFAVAVPVAWAGAIGPTVSTVRDAADPPNIADTTLTGRDRSSDSPFALPEFAGASNLMTGLTPIVFSAVSLVPVAALREDPTVGTAVRSVVGVALCLAVMVWWIRRRDRLAVRVREFFAEGRALS